MTNTFAVTIQDVTPSYVDESESVKLTTDFSNEEALVHKVIFDGESPDVLLRLFAHPEKAQRVKMASAFAAVNVEFTHDEESGFAEKREQFWIDVEEQLPDIQNALLADKGAGGINFKSLRHLFGIFYGTFFRLLFISNKVKIMNISFTFRSKDRGQVEVPLLVHFLYKIRHTN